MARPCVLSSTLIKLSLGVLAMRDSLELDEVDNSVALGRASWLSAERAAALCQAAACDKHSSSAARSFSFVAVLWMQNFGLRVCSLHHCVHTIM